MDRGHAIGAVRADDGEVGHADLSLGTFLDEADALNASFVARKAGPDGVQQAPIDLEDDLQVARHHALEPGERQFLQRFRQ